MSRLITIALEKVLYLVNADSDIFCEIYKGDRCIAMGYLSDLDLESDIKIETYRLGYDGVQYLILHLA